MSETVKQILQGHVPAWLLAAVILFVLLGPQGVWRIIDRIFPPDEVVKVEQLADGLDKLQSRSGKIDLVLQNQRSIIASIQSILVRIDDAKDRLDDMSARLSRLEVWRITQEREFTPRPDQVPIDRP